MTVKKAYVDTEEGQVHYRYGGNPGGEEAPIVFFHQNPSSSRMFEETIADIADEYDAVAPDMPGYGGSYTPEDEAVTTFRYYPEVLEEAIDNLGIEEMHVVGHHTGAGVAVEVANDLPDRTLTVTLIGPPYSSQEEREAVLQEVYGDTPIPPLDEDGGHLVEHWETMKGEGESLAATHVMTVDAIVAREGNRQSYHAGRDQDLPSLFEAIDAPRMLMGSEDDVLWEAFQRAREANPEARAVEIEGGNWAPMLDPESVTSELRTFLADNGY